MSGPIIVRPGEGARVGNVEFLARTADTPRFTFGIIEIAPGVEMTLARQAISKAVSPDEDEFEYDDETPAQTEQGRFDEVVASYDTEAAPDVQATGFERPADDDPRDEPRRDDDSR